MMIVSCSLRPFLVRQGVTWFKESLQGLEEGLRECQLKAVENDLQFLLINR